MRHVPPQAQKADRSRSAADLSGAKRRGRRARARCLRGPLGEPLPDDRRELAGAVGEHHAVSVAAGADLRKVVYTTNSLENLNRQTRSDQGPRPLPQRGARDEADLSGDLPGREPVALGLQLERRAKSLENPLRRADARLSATIMTKPGSHTVRRRVSRERPGLFLVVPRGAYGWLTVARSSNPSGWARTSPSHSRPGHQLRQLALPAPPPRGSNPSSIGGIHAKFRACRRCSDDPEVDAPFLRHQRPVRVTRNQIKPAIKGRANTGSSLDNGTSSVMMAATTARNVTPTTTTATPRGCRSSAATNRFGCPWRSHSLSLSR